MRQSDMIAVTRSRLYIWRVRRPCDAWRVKIPGRGAADFNFAALDGEQTALKEAIRFRNSNLRFRDIPERTVARLRNKASSKRR